MIKVPWLIISLCERLPKGFVQLGDHDMTMPAAHAVRDGSFSKWSTGYIPEGAMISLHLPHEARMAAWNRRLYSFDLPHIACGYEAKVARFGGADRLIDYLQNKYAARDIRRQAEALLNQIGKADFVSSRDVAALAHPVTGELLRVDDGRIAGDPPFAFAGADAVWPGVDPRELVEYARAGGSYPDAAGYLEATFPGPTDMLEDVEGLDAALSALRYYGDPAMFRKLIEDWNRRNSFSVTRNDRTTVVALVGEEGRSAALAWCRRFVASARTLEDSIDELYVNP